MQQLVQSQQSLLAQVAAHATAQQSPAPAGLPDARRHQQQLDSLQEHQAQLDQQGAAVKALQAEVLQAQREAQASVQATAAWQAGRVGPVGQHSRGAAPAWAADCQQAESGHAAVQEGVGGPPCVSLHEVRRHLPGTSRMHWSSLGCLPVKAQLPSRAHHWMDVRWSTVITRLRTS